MYPVDRQLLLLTETKSKFKYYEFMRFLNDSLQIRQTVSSLTDASEVGTSLDIRNEQHKNDAVARPSTLQISTINNSPQISTCFFTDAITYFSTLKKETICTICNISLITSRLLRKNKKLMLPCKQL